MIFLDKNIDDSTYLENLINRNYFARFAFCLIIGVLVAYYVEISYTTCVITALVSLILLVLAYIFMRQTKRIFLYNTLFRALSATLVICFGFMLTYNHLVGLHHKWSDSNTNYKVQITDVLKSTEQYYQYEAYVDSEIHNDSVTEISQNVIFYYSKNDTTSQPNIGDICLINAQFSLHQNDAFSSFDYQKYLLTKGISATAYIQPTNLDIISKTSDNTNLIVVANRLRHNLSDRISSNPNIFPTNSSLISSILLGDKSGLTAEQKDIFSASGASHVLAVSGLHVGIIYGLFILLFSSKIKQRKSKLRIPLFLLSLFAMWTYAFITGLSPSVVRATLMFSLFLLDRFFGNERFEGKVIAFAAIIMIIINPLVVFDIGFQLSFVAVISIIGITPQITSLFRFNNSFQHKIIQLFAVPLAAQIGTFPLVLYYFHQFPVYFLVSNMLVTILAPIIIYGGMMFLLFSSIPIIGNTIAFTLNIITDFFGESIYQISTFSSSLAHAWIEWWAVLLLYVVVFVFFLMIRNFSFKKFCILFSMIIIYTIFVSRIDTSTFEDEMFIIPKNKTLMVNHLSKHRNDIYTNDSIIASTKFADVWLKNNSPTPKYHIENSLSNNCFTFSGKSHLILRDEVMKQKYNVTGAPLEVDVLIVDRGVYPSTGFFTKAIKPRHKIILTNGVSHYYIDKFKQLAHTLNVECYSIREQGSYIETNEQ